MEKIFEQLFTEKVIRPSVVFTNVDAESLERLKQVVMKVKLKHKNSNVELDYDVMSSKLTVRGTSLDLFYFGYYTKELE